MQTVSSSNLSGPERTAAIDRVAGFINGLDFILTGEVDDYARTVLGFTEEPPKPLEEYMPLAPTNETEE